MIKIEGNKYKLPDGRYYDEEIGSLFMGVVVPREFVEMLMQAWGYQKERKKPRKKKKKKKNDEEPPEEDNKEEMLPVPATEDNDSTEETIVLGADF